MKTIIYYSSNREDPKFEDRVIKNILRVSGGLPIISVTQRPTKLGKNICVGNVGVSGFNMFRQVQIALQNIDSKFVISAEADCLYPPDYFTFTPERDDVPYRNTNLYVMPDRRAYYFHKKEGATHSQIVGRDFYLKKLDELFSGAPKWCPEEINFPKERNGEDDVFGEVEHYSTENPVVQIKTHKGMRYYTHSDRTPIYTLPYWGDGLKFRNYYLKGKV